MPRPTGRVTIGVLVLLAAGVATACDSSGPTWPSDPREVDFHPDLGVELDSMVRTASGLYFQDLDVGSDAPAAPGDTVAIRYRGWLPDATVFAETAAGEVTEFVLGLGRVIPGWDEGVQGMREQGSRLLVLPPDLAYGVQGLPDRVPPETVVVFRMQLVEVRRSGS